MSITSSSNSWSNSQPWIYFLSGALVPSIAYFFLWKYNQKGSNDDEKDDDTSEDDTETDSELFGVSNSGPSSKWNIVDAPYKMILLVNMELNMGKGKIAAQVGHAAVGCYKRARRQCPGGLAAWERTGCAKIALKCPTQNELEEVAISALERDIPLYLVEDAGRTQIAAGSRTVLGLGPAPVHVFAGLTDHFKLM